MDFKFYFTVGMICVTLAARGCHESRQARQTQVLGQVTDDSGGLIQGALLEFVGHDQTASIETNQGGSFRLFLKPGTYDVKVAYANFKTVQIRGASVERRQTQFNFHLARAVNDQFEMKPLEIPATSIPSKPVEGPKNP